MISIIVPVYNEKDNINPLYDKVVSEMKKIGYKYELIFINDGSNDGTPDVLRALAGKDKKVKFISFDTNYGQTAAIMAGFNQSRGEIIIPLDGDLQNDPADIKKMLDKMNEGYDVVSGWRKDRKDNVLLRNFPSRIANILISWITGVALHDYGCSLKAYKKTIIKNIKLYGEMHRFIPVYASWHGAKIAEIPVAHYPRKYGKSKYGLKRVFKVLLDLLVLVFLRKYSQKPMHFFGQFAFYNFFASILSIGFMIYFKYWGGKSFIQTPLPMLVVLFGLIGFVSLFFGLLAEIQNRTYHEAQDKQVYVIKEKKNI